MVKMDHNPLVGLLKLDIRDASGKLQPLLEFCGGYNFQIEYIPGKKNKVADLHSRNPLWGNGPTIWDEWGRVVAVESFHQWIKDDPRMEGRQCKQFLQGGSQSKIGCPMSNEHGAREFHKWWDRIGLMSEKEDTIMEMDGHRIVVPHGARKNIHKLLHVPHMATARTRKAAAKRFFWVGMADEVKTIQTRRTPGDATDKSTH